MSLNLEKNRMHVQVLEVSSTTSPLRAEKPNKFEFKAIQNLQLVIDVLMKGSR